MKSTAHFKGHPIHPMLIPFPIAFFTGTLLADIVYYYSEIDSFGSIAYYLNIAGVAFALLAAVPGIIDFIYTVPPKSSAKKRGVKHGAINVTVVIIFAIVFFLRRDPDVNYLLIIFMEIVAVAGLIVAGWMGGTLVYRNQIGVDPRTANAGKWKELYLKINNSAIDVDEKVELKEDQMILIHADDKRIVLARSGGELMAFDDHCTHRGGSLAGGMLICGTVQCPWHGSQFDIRSGDVKAGPAKEKINTYQVQEVDGKVRIRV